MIHLRKISCLLTQIESTHDNMRSKEVSGHCVKLPELNRPFQLMADSLDPEKDVRVITTSPVQDLRHNTMVNRITFRTMNSRYSLQILD